MLVEHVGRHALHGRGGDDLQIGIVLLDGVIELREAAVVGAGVVELIFVADFDVVQRERRGVAVFGAFRAPFGIGAAGDIFNFVERVLHVRLERGAGIDVLLRQRVAGVDGEHRLHLQVFAPLQKFKQAHAVRRAIAPGAHVRGTVDPGADGLLPVEAVGDVVAFKIIAAGQAQEFGLHGGQQIHKVDAIAVGPVVIGGREERDEIEPDRCRLCDGQDEVIVRARRAHRRF